MQEMRPYLIHPTVVDLQAASPLFPLDLYNQPVGDIARLLQQYKVPNPGRPPITSEKQAAVWEMLAMMDVAGQRMRVTYMMLLRQFSIAGTTMCDALKQFNSTSWKLYDVQAEILAALAKGGYVVPAKPPYPTLFTNLSVCAVRATPVSPANPSGVGIDTQDPTCGPSGMAGGELGWVWVPVLVGVAIISYFGYRSLDAISGNLRDVFVAKEITRQATLEAEFQMIRAAKASEEIQRCIAAGGDPPSCVEKVYAGLPTELKALRNMAGAMSGDGERGIFFWLGVVSVAAGAGVGGYAFYRWRRKTRKRARAEAPA